MSTSSTSHTLSVVRRARPWQRMPLDPPTSTPSTSAPIRSRYVWRGPRAGHGVASLPCTLDCVNTQPVDAQLVQRDDRCRPVRREGAEHRTPLGVAHLNVAFALVGNPVADIVLAFGSRVNRVRLHHTSWRPVAPHVRAHGVRFSPSPAFSCLQPFTGHVVPSSDHSSLRPLVVLAAGPLNRHRQGERDVVAGVS